MDFDPARGLLSMNVEICFFFDFLHSYGRWKGGWEGRGNEGREGGRRTRSRTGEKTTTTDNRLGGWQPV